MKCLSTNTAAAAWAVCIASLFLVGEADAHNVQYVSCSLQTARVAISQAGHPHQSNASMQGDRSIPTMRLGMDDGSGAGGALVTAQWQAWSKQGGVYSLGTLKGCGRILSHADRQSGKHWIPVTSVERGPFSLVIGKPLGRNRADESDELSSLPAVHSASGLGPPSVADSSSSIGSFGSRSGGPSATATSARAFTTIARHEPLQAARDSGLDDFFGIDVPADVAFSEPPAYAMLLTGLGVIGFIVFRRVSHL